MPDRLTTAYQMQLRRTREAVGSAVANQWQRLGSYNEADVPEFVSRVTPIVAAGQTRAVALSNAYVARKLGVTPYGVNVPDLRSTLRNGTPPEVVYRRPFVTVWTALSNGDDWETAVQSGQAQAESSSLMDVALAMTAAYLVFGALSASSGDEIVAWRRVAESNCCDFCQMLDGVHTGPTEPQPLHNRCGCTAEPITRKSSPADFVTPGDTVGDVTIHQHGELGPVITQAGDHFTTEAEALAGQ